MNKEKKPLNKARLAFIVSIVALFVVPIAVGFGLSSFSGGFTWDTPDESFLVYADAGHTILATEGIEDLGVLSVGQHVFTYYVVNDGGVAITVNVTKELISGASNVATWSSTSLPLGVGGSGSLTLTLDVNESGSYDWQFTLA